MFYYCVAKKMLYQVDPMYFIIIEKVMNIGTVGKCIIALSLCLQAYLLFQSELTIKLFDQQLTRLLSSCECMPVEVALHVQQYLRLVVIGLLASSVLMIISRSVLPKIFALLGVVVMFVIKNYPLGKLPSIDDTSFFQYLALVGGILYLLGADNQTESITNQNPTPKKMKLKRD